MKMRRNSDAQTRELHRRAGTGDLEAAKLLVRAMERAGRDRVLAEPLSLEQIRDMASENDGTVTGVVVVNLGSVIGTEAESFLDMLSERLTGTELLGDVQYKVIGLGDEEDDLLIEVNGDAATILENASVASPCARCAAEAGVVGEIDGLVSPERRRRGSPSPLCDACSQVQDSCDEGCAEHARLCSGFCDHARPSHMNACLADNEARIARIQVERRRAHADVCSCEGEDPDGPGFDPACPLHGTE